MKYTISTHFGHTPIAFKHLRRNPEVTAKEPHIDPNGQHEIWMENAKTLKEAYDQLFSDSVKEWNERQIKKGNHDRVIHSYLEQLKHQKKHPAYELIVTVGSSKDPEPIPDDVLYKRNGYIFFKNFCNSIFNFNFFVLS